MKILRRAISRLSPKRQNDEVDPDRNRQKDVDWIRGQVQDRLRDLEGIKGSVSPDMNDQVKLQQRLVVDLKRTLAEFEGDYGDIGVDIKASLAQVEKGLASLQKISPFVSEIASITAGIRAPVDAEPGMLDPDTLRSEIARLKYLSHISAIDQPDLAQYSHDQQAIVQRAYGALETARASLPELLQSYRSAAADFQELIDGSSEDLGSREDGLSRSDVDEAFEFCTVDLMSPRIEEDDVFQVRADERRPDDISMTREAYEEKRAEAERRFGGLER